MRKKCPPREDGVVAFNKRIVALNKRIMAIGKLDLQIVEPGNDCEHVGVHGDDLLGKVLVLRSIMRPDAVNRE